MKSPLVSENQAKLTYLKRELVRRVSRSTLFDSHCHYIASKSKMPVGVKKLIKEIGELEKEMGLRASEGMLSDKKSGAVLSEIRSKR